VSGQKSEISVKSVYDKNEMIEIEYGIATLKSSPLTKAMQSRNGLRNICTPRTTSKTRIKAVAFAKASQRQDQPIKGVTQRIE